MKAEQSEPTTQATDLTIPGRDISDSAVLTQLPFRVLAATDICRAWEAHQDHALDEEGKYRKFDPTVPYVAHPIWCAMTIWCEPNLPSELRHVGARVLLYHDQPEETSKELPAHLSAQVTGFVDDMTFPGGSAQERSEIWFRPAEVRLFKLYDRVSNLFDGSWMEEKQRDTHFRYLRALNADVKQNYPGLNISLIADALFESHKLAGFSPEDRVRVSIANLAPRVRCGDEVFYLGILNRKQFEKGKRVFSALGGAAELTDDGIAELQGSFAAELSEGRDARFIVQAKHLYDVMDLFDARRAEFYEIDPGRELGEDLGNIELPGMPAVLSADEAAAITFNYIGSQRQPVAKHGTSARESADIPSRRFFNLYEIVVPEAIFKKMRLHPALGLFTEAELIAATAAGGKVLGREEVSIADNIFPF